MFRKKRVKDLKFTHHSSDLVHFLSEVLTNKLHKDIQIYNSIVTKSRKFVQLLKK